MSRASRSRARAVGFLNTYAAARGGLQAEATTLTQSRDVVY